MNLADWLHCPRCKSRLAPVAAILPTHPPEPSPAQALQCANCEWIIPIVDDVADFVGHRMVSASDPFAFAGNPSDDDAASADLMAQIRTAAEGRWPASLGEVLELGCGSGQMTRMLVMDAEVRGLMVTDTAMEMVHRCRDRLAENELGMDTTIIYARLSGKEDAIRDAVADTVVGTCVLHRFGDVRAFLTMVHRVLKPAGRAFFIVPNRRYHQAFCQATATALVRLHARDGVWSEPSHAVMLMLAELRQQLLHQGDRTFLSSLREKHLFDSDAMQDLAREVGFATVDAVPLHPDPLGGEITRRFCHDAGIPDAFANELAPLVASAGAPFFSLLSRQDASASMLLWLVKGVGPTLRTFSVRPEPPAVGFTAPDSALGGAPPRWSVELAARDLPDGVVVSVGGWCLVNTDVVWLRLGLNGVSRDVPVWRPRPDVHGALNPHGLYHPLNALCCGMAIDLLFDGVHPRDNECPLRVEIVLANGLIARGPAPLALVMDEPLVIAQ